MVAWADLKGPAVLIDCLGGSLRRGRLIPCSIFKDKMMNPMANRNVIAQEAWGELLEIAAHQRDLRADERASPRAWGIVPWQRHQGRSPAIDHATPRANRGRHAGSYDPEQVVITRLLLQLILRKIFTAFEDVIPKLGDGDHDLISRLYGLEEFYPPKAPPPSFRAPSASRQAERRARQRLTEATEEWLETDLKAHPDDRQIIRFARETVRGDRLMKVIEFEVALSEDFSQEEAGDGAEAEVHESQDSGVDQTKNSEFREILEQLWAAREEVYASLPDLTHRELTWATFQQLTTGPLWNTVEKLDNDPYRQQLADVLDAAVSRLEAFQLNDSHFAAIDFTLSRMSTQIVTEKDVDACEDKWLAAKVTTIPTLQTSFEEWLTNSSSGFEDVG